LVGREGLAYLLERAQHLHRTGRHAEAVAVYRQVVARDPGVGSAWINLAMLLGKAGAQDQALRAFRRFLEVAGPEDAPFLSLAEAELRAAGCTPPPRKPPSDEELDTVAIEVTRGDEKSLVLATNDAGVPLDNLQSTVREFTDAHSWADAYLVVDAHPELMSQVGRLLLRLESEGGATHEAQIAALNLQVLERCVEVGPAVAFAEAQEMTTDEFGALVRAVRDIQPTLREAAEAGTEEEMIARLRARPDILEDPGTDMLLAHLWRENPPEGRSGVESLRSIVEHARAGDVTPSSDQNESALLALVQRADASGDVAEIRRAIAMLRDADSRVVGDPRGRVPYLVTLGGSLLRLFEMTGDHVHLAQAADAIREARAVEGDFTWRSPAIHGQLGSILFRTAEHHGDPRVRAESLSFLEWAVRATGRDAPERASRQVNLTNSLILCGEAGDQSAVDRAVAIAEEVIARLDEADAAMPHALLSLARAHRLAYDWSGDERRADVAIGAYRRLIGRHDLAARDLARARANLGVLLGRRFGATGGVGHLDEAVELLEGAAATFGAGSVESGVHTASLASLLLTRAHERDNSADLRRAIELYRDALASPATPASVRGETTANLGSALVQLAVRTSDRATFDEGMGLWKRAVTAHDPVAYPGHVLRVGFGVGLQLARAGAFRDAARVLARGVVALEEADALSAGSASRPRLAASAAPIVQLAAYALGRVGDIEGAVEMLERHRARLMRDALDLDPVKIDQLASEGHGRLANQYARTADELAQWQRREPSEAGEGAASHIRQLRARRDELLREIRSLPGRAGFALPPDVTTIRGAASRGPLVYASVTELGSAAFVVGAQEGQVRSLDLPELTQVVVAERTASYLSALDAFRAAPDLPDRAGRFAAALADVAGWLGAEIIKPICDVLAEWEVARAVLLLPGRLGLLPVAAASTSSGRYLLDGLEWRSAPSAAALARTADVARDGVSGSIAIVANPQPTTAPPIEAATAEAHAAARSFASTTLLTGAGATRRRIMAALPNHDVAHFACHGYGKPESPLESHLLLASDEQLTLRDLLRLRMWRMRLCFLSACDSGVIGSAAPDEVVSLPAGLIEAGAAGVIATHWPVWDAVACVLGIKFYALWPATEPSPATALWTAQRWLRTARHREIVELIGESVADGSVGPMMDQLSAFSSDDIPFSDPVDWASFVYVGA
jgi:CHAT domain-containing protein